MPRSEYQQFRNSGLIVEFPTHRNRKNVQNAAASKNVTFSVNSTLHMYINHYDDDGVEKHQQYSSWYTKQDYDSFRSDSKAVIASYSKLITNDINKASDRSYACDNELCTLGIEIYLNKELFLKVATGRSLHKQAVFAEQARQVECYGCFDDWNEMAAALKKSSAFSTTRAIMNAKYLHRQTAKQSLRRSRASCAA